MIVLFENKAGKVFESEDGVELEVEIGENVENDDIIELTKNLATFSMSEEIKEKLSPKDLKKYINQMAMQMLSDANMIKKLPPNESGELKGEIEFNFGEDDEED